MDLWIRTQDKRQLLKVNDGLYIANGFTDTDDTFIGIKNVGHVGRYAEEERALEVLEEIQKSICTTFNLKPKIPIHMDDLAAAKVYLEDLNDIKLITAGTEFEIGPISTNTFVYQMPEE